MRFLLILIVSMIYNLSYSQSISGKVLSDDEPNGLPFVNIKVLSTEKGSISDINGVFKIDLNEGVYKIVLSCLSYKTDTLEVRVYDKDVYIEHRMLSNDYKIEDVVIQAKSNKESEISLSIERKNSSDIIQNIGYNELQRSGSSNISEGLVKVAGVSTQSNYIFIRGMGDRYNNSYINRLPVPSIDPDSKMMPMDIFPNQIIKNINVNKSYDVGEYGDFSGGYINIKTKDYPDELLLKVDIGSDINTQSLIEFKSFDVSNFNPCYRYPFNYNSNITFGNYLEKNKSKFGFLINAYNKTQNRFEFGTLKTTNTQGVERISYEFDNYKERKDYTGLLSFYYEIGKNRINFNSIYLNSNTNSFRETNGYHFDYLDSIYTRRYTPIRRRLLINQILGNFKLKSIDVDYGISYSNVGSKEENRRQLVYLHRNGIYRINDIDILDNHKFYSILNENDLSGYLESNFKIRSINIQFGFDYRNKKRFFDYDQYIYDFKYPDLVSLNSPDGSIDNSTIVEVLNPASRYDADLNIKSIFTSLKIDRKRLYLKVGTRIENSIQGIKYRDQQQPLFLRSNIIDNTNLLSSINLKYTLNGSNIIKSTISNTLSRPSFREVAPFEYTEVFAGIKTIGNPNLINSRNYNLDIRYENYSNFFGMFSITTFSKVILNPIEKTMLATSSGQLQSFDNAKMAKIYGSEFELTRNFKINDFSKVNINTNITILKSIVDINSNSGSINTNQKRPLQGSSPILYNFDISYNNKFNKFDSYITLSFNRFGYRLWSVGIQGLGDIYENPVSNLNLTFRNTIDGKVNINFSINNILDPEYKITQNTINGDAVLNKYKTGINFGFGFGYMIF